MNVVLRNFRFWLKLFTIHNCSLNSRIQADGTDFFACEQIMMYFHFSFALAKVILKGSLGIKMLWTIHYSLGVFFYGP